jgi:hypothetical protein
LRSIVVATLALAGGCAFGSGPPAPDPTSPWAPLAHLIDSAVAVGAAPGAVLGVSWRGQQFFYGAGKLGEGATRRPDAETVYDLASLTKVIGLTTPPGGVVGNAADWLVGHRIAESSVKRFLDDVAGKLSETAA